MTTHFGTALRITIISIVIFGLIYPLAMTGIARALFPYQANGSLVMRGGAAVGSEAIGQLWTKPQYFHGRPSAAGKGYDPVSTGGTNLGPASKKLIGATRAALAALRKENPHANAPVPIDLVTSSGSGIDPDISPAGAYYQAPRVAAARGIALAKIDALIERSIEGRTLGILGEPRVNVLRLNLALHGCTNGGC
ncbi:MAG TPA: potassium-transporting ATPase subunit KdpC [Candidatus Baltobacteraceae bacterium]|jgi:K+-transporting ATPase ATPase C chain|nr:potassium-transporting ATPase subunit KdpC [Candidatus Baltobacteraceae bacterium]